VTVATADFISNAHGFPFGAPTVAESVLAFRRLADAIEAGSVRPLFVGVASATREDEYLTTELTFRFVEMNQLVKETK
jgi:hypothetical protein